MTRVTHVVQWIPLLYMCIYLVFWIRIYSNELIQFDEFVLEKQVNYAADAAVEELLMTGNTEQDYNKGEYIVVEPELALIEFTSILTEDFNLVPTDFTREQIKEKYIKSLLICTWDGVYAYWYQPENSTGEYGLVGTPKIPYFYTDANGRQYCLNLGFEKAYSDNGKTGDEYKINKYEKLDPMIPKDVQLTAINNQVADILNYTLIQAYGGSTARSYEIPALASEVSGAQPVDQITVIGVIEGQASVGTSAVVSECIGGAQITANDPIIGVTMKYKSGTLANVYARSSYWKEKLPKLATVPNLEGIIQKGDPSSTAWNITNAKSRFFDTPFEAAEEGYYDLLTTLEGGA